MDRDQSNNLIFMIVGAGGILVSLLLPGNRDIQYLPGDVRGEAWFWPTMSLLAAGWSTIFLAVGVIRFVRARRRGK